MALTLSNEGAHTHASNVVHLAAGQNQRSHVNHLYDKISMFIHICIYIYIYMLWLWPIGLVRFLMGFFKWVRTQNNVRATMA